MDRLWRKLKLLLAIALACTAGTLPACGTMGGGGMKYLVDPPFDISDLSI
jgi:hypothetical protein